MSSWHRQYRGKSSGRIFHFLYHYCGFDIAEKACLKGENEIVYHNEVIASYKFLGDTDIPHFTFNPIFSYSGTPLKEMWDQAQKDKWHIAIADADDAKPEPCNECRSLRLEVSILRGEGIG